MVHLVGLQHLAILVEWAEKQPWTTGETLLLRCAIFVGREKLTVAAFCPNDLEIWSDGQHGCLRFTPMKQMFNIFRNSMSLFFNTHGFLESKALTGWWRLVRFPGRDFKSSLFQKRIHASLPFDIIWLESQWFQGQTMGRLKRWTLGGNSEPWNYEPSRRWIWSTWFGGNIDVDDSKETMETFTSKRPRQLFFYGKSVLLIIISIRSTETCSDSEVRNRSCSS